MSMRIFLNVTGKVFDAMPLAASGPFDSGIGVAGLVALILIFLVFMVVMVVSISIWAKRMEVMTGKDAYESKKTLTPTQKFILAASSPTLGNNYKCVIDIWDTHTSESKVEQVKELFEWGWGDFTYENAKEMAEDCIERGYNSKYKEYCNSDPNSPEIALKYNAMQRQLLEEMKQKYPKQGMLAWDLVRALSVVGGAYMGGIMEYGEAAKIAFQVCKILQENFSSWDDMVGNYTLGYQFWRGEKKKDRLKYYKKLKRTWIYKISWNTVLKEEELRIGQN